MTAPNKAQHTQNPKYYNQQYNQARRSVSPQQNHGVAQFNSLPHQNIHRKTEQHLNDFAQFPQHYSLSRQSSLNPPFPTTDITFTTYSPPTVSPAHNSSYQSRHRDQVPNLQKVQPPGARSPSEGVGGGVDRGGLYTYPPRNEAKQYYANDNPLNSGKGQVHSLDRYNYQQKPQTFVNQQHTGQKHVPDFSNSLPRVGPSHPQTGFPISLDSPTRHPTTTVYTKHVHEGFPQQQNGGAFHKNTDSHINAPSVQTNANWRGEPQYTQSIGGSQNNASRQLDSSRLRELHSGIANPVVRDVSSGNFTPRNYPSQSWDSVNGSEGRIGSPVSVKVGSQGSSIGGDSDTDFPRATVTGNSHTPVIQNFPSVYNDTQSSPLSSISTTSDISSQTSPPVLPFNTAFPSHKPSGDQSFDNWAFGNFHNNMMANANDQMKAMEENMKRMQKHMEEQFKNFNMNNPPSFAPPDGFPPLMDPAKIMVPQKGINESLIPGVPTPVPNFTSQPTGYAAITGSPSSGQSTPVSTMTSKSSALAVPPSPAHPGMDTMELNRCIQNTPDGKKHLQLKFDMQDFKPEEVSVKKDKNRLEVHAHHEEKEPNRVACKVFHQQYHLPKNVRLAKMEYDMDPEGTLTVRSPVKPRHNVKFEEGTKTGTDETNSPPNNKSTTLFWRNPSEKLEHVTFNCVRNFVE